jgi:hypothetical protein
MLKRKRMTTGRAYDVIYHGWGGAIVYASVFSCGRIKSDVICKARLNNASMCNARLAVDTV